MSDSETIGAVTRTLKLMEALSGEHELGVSRSLPGGPSSAPARCTANSARW